MEDNGKDFQKEMMDAVAQLQARVAKLEKEVAELRGEEVPAEDVPADFSDPIDIDFLADVAIEPATAEPLPAAEEVPVPTVEDIPDFADLPEVSADEAPVQVEAAEPEPVVLPEPVAEPEQVAAPEPEPEPTTLADLFGKPAEESETLNYKKGAHKGKAVIDVFADKMPWRTEMPGSVVKDVRSAISLNDRVMFIHTLFREDSMLFQDTMKRINEMSDLDEAVKYLTETFPEWKMDSETVFRFMMAVRRKLR